MSLDVRHAEKTILFRLLRARCLNPIIAELDEINDVIHQLIATMEPVDVELVEKQVEDYMQRRKGAK